MSGNQIHDNHNPIRYFKKHCVVNEIVDLKVKRLITYLYCVSYPYDLQKKNSLLLCI